MRIVYIADDGTEFQDQFACEDYEWATKMINSGIAFFDKEGLPVKSVLSEDDYGEVCTVYVPDENAINFLKEFVDYTGFVSFDDINTPGIWVWNDEPYNWRFVKKND